MVQLYTAVGKYKLRKEPDGRKLPIISVGLNECALTIEEMLIWSTLIWNIMTEDELRKIYDKKALGAGISGDKFDITLKRLISRNLVVSEKAISGDDALYKLLSNLYIVPVSSSLLTKIRAFIQLVVFQKVSFSLAKNVFLEDKLNDIQKKILNLSKQTLLSSAEILKCIENGVTDVSTREKVLDALYDDDYSTCDNMSLFIKFYDNHREVMEAIATLYLRKNIVFDKLI